MDQQAFEAGKAAYQRGDWAQASQLLSQAKGAGELSGGVDHLRGNSLMKLGLYQDAAAAYADALRDTSYGKVGALSCNRGRALAAAGDLDGAVESLTRATQDPEYPTPYKAFIALGAAQLAKGDPREAGIAFRSAAIDDTNPDPSSALVKLGECFMTLGRALDAVEAYRTALDFSVPLGGQNQVYANLGRAYVSANRMSEACDAFNHALADGTYRLTPEEQTASLAAQNAMARIGRTPSDTDKFLAAAGYGDQESSGAYDPLDPTGASGAFMPSPEDTGFFSVTEKDLMNQEKQDRKANRKHRHTGLKVFLTIVIILLVAAGGAAFAYYRGFGYPTQEMVVKELFQAQTSGQDLGTYIAGSVSSDMRKQIESVVPTGATPSVDGIDQSMSTSTVRVTATLSQGGKQVYTVTMSRDGITWKVTGVEIVYDSQGGTTPAVTSGTTTTTGTVAATSAAATTAS